MLGQWRLYSAAYGDNGATQKIAPLSLVAFPHLFELRHAAEMARYLADRAAAAGHLNEALRIRRSMTWIGIRMETARWSLEAISGAEIVLIITTDHAGANGPITIHNRRDWEKQAANYLALLGKARLKHEILWVSDAAEAACDLRMKVDIARYDASYPGMPPGIPLVPLFGDWIIGVCLLQQMLGLSAAALVAFLCCRVGLPRPLRLTLRFAIFFGTVIFGSLLLTGIPTTRLAIGFTLCLAALALFAMEALSQTLKRTEAKGKRQKAKEGSEVESATIQNPISNIQNQAARAAALWQTATTARMLILLLPPGAALLYWLRPELSVLHPVATLLMSVMGASRVVSPADAIGLALMACGLPVAFALLVGFWALYRRVSPLAGPYGRAAALHISRASPASRCFISVCSTARCSWTPPPVGESAKSRKTICNGFSRIAPHLTRTTATQKINAPQNQSRQRRAKAINEIEVMRLNPAIAQRCAISHAGAQKEICGSDAPQFPNQTFFCFLSLPVTYNGRGKVAAAGT